MLTKKYSYVWKEKRPFEMAWVHYTLLIAVCNLLFFSGHTLAEQANIQLIYNNSNNTHLAYIATLKKELSNFELNINYADSSVEKLVASKEKVNTDIYVGTGVDAANYLSSISPGKPALYALIPVKSVPDQTAQHELGCYPQCVFSVLDQPIKRQLKLLRYSLPNSKRVGLLYGSHSEILASNLRQQIKSSGLEVFAERHNRKKSLMENLSPILGKSDLLFAVPDPEIYNRQTARSIILTTYAKRIPIFGYSKAYTRAGALLSLHSSPQQLARHNAKIIADYFQGKKMRYGIVYPKYFSVTTNQTVARSLRLRLDSSESITNWLREHDDISTDN